MRALSPLKILEQNIALYKFKIRSLQSVIDSFHGNLDSLLILNAELEELWLILGDLEHEFNLKKGFFSDF